ncbi:uncharacterized protein N7483_002226 [Penicillium malachiteum]|uniref:uncharacterized protein n=1 Tax=Penicillium malachiteum TaxID=1324776 RepID=UPI002547B4FD|nr:uncharacterized protein N7483_002226 [Penicillium malachiteum]KAJ5737101.1 hypothetical protein N7483_002226 [Penicillium malachiteum]
MLSLECTYVEDNEDYVHKFNVLSGNWEIAKDLFKDPANKDFSLKASLKSRNEDTEPFEVWDILSPWVKSYRPLKAGSSTEDCI